MRVTPSKVREAASGPASWEEKPLVLGMPYGERVGRAHSFGTVSYVCTCNCQRACAHKCIASFSKDARTLPRGQVVIFWYRGIRFAHAK